MSRSNWRLKKHAPRTAPAESPFGCGPTIHASRPAAGTEIRISASGRTATIKAAEGDGEGAKLGTFEGNAYTGAAMRPDGWWRPIVVDLAGVRVPSQHRPVLRQHDPEQIVGHTEKVTVVADGADKGIRIAGVFSGEKQHTDKVTVPGKNGFQWQLSIGATPVRVEELAAGKTAVVNGEEFTGPLDISRETDLGEISFVPLGADGNTSATVQASKGRNRDMYKAALLLAKLNGNVRAAKYNDDEIDKMSDDEAKAALKKCMAEGDDDKKAKAADDDKAKAKAEDDEKAKAKAAEDEEKKTESAADARIKARRKAEADEERRCDAIRATAKQYGVTLITAADGKTKVNFAAHAIENGWSEDKVRAEAMQVALDRTRGDRPGSGVGGPLVYSTSSPEVSEAVLEAAVLHAARHQFKLNDDDFYTQPTPDGKGTMRRTPAYVEADARRDFRARYTDQVQQAAHTMFRGRIAPQQLFRAGFGAWGGGRDHDYRTESGVRSMLEAWDHSERGIRAEGGSSISIANVLANVLNKFALQGYLFTEQAWRDICAVRPVNDFKPTKSINLLGDVMYKALGPNGELENASLGDQAFANQAQPFGRILTIPWTHIVNDDLGMLTGAPMKIGQGAGLALNDVLWTVFKNMVAGTVNGDDGNAFFRTTSSQTAAAKKTGVAYNANKMTGGASALSATALATAKALFDNQTDPNGNPLGFDGVMPVLLHGPSNWQTASALMQAAAIVYGGGSAALQPNANVWAGMLKPVMSRYVENANYLNTATGWGVLFNPAALAAIEVAFLNGVDNPAVLTAGPDYQYDKLGISIRGTMPFGVTQQNFRAAVWSAGA